MFLNKFRTVKRNDSTIKDKSSNPIDTSQYGSNSGSKDLDGKHVRNVSEKPNFDLFLKMEGTVKEKPKDQLSERAINVDNYGSNSTETKSVPTGSISNNFSNTLT